MHASPPAVPVGLSTPRTAAGAAVRAPSAALSASKQERLEALRNERLRIMQMQSSILARPRTAMGTTPGRSIATPPPLLFRNTPMKEVGNENIHSNAAVEEIARLKDEIRQLKINEELIKERMKELENAVARSQEERDRLERELVHNARGSVSVDEVAKLKQQLTREKDRVFVLCTEKQKLEEEVHDLKIERFSAEKTLSEIEVLKSRLDEAGDWESVKASLESDIDTLRRDNEGLKRDLKSEKSQRLVLLARIEELEKQVRDQKRLIDSTPVSDSNAFKRASVVSSIPPVVDDAIDDTRRSSGTRDVFFSNENQAVTQSVLPKMSLPGVVAAASRHPGHGSPRSAVDQPTTPPTNKSSSAKHESHNWYSAQIPESVPIQEIPSFYDDVEKRGSAKKDYFEADQQVTADVGDLFGGGSVSAEAGSTEAPQAGDIGDLFGNSPPKQKDTWGGTSSTDDWMSGTQQPAPSDPWGSSTPYQETPPDNQWGAQQQSWNQQHQWNQPKQPSPKSQPVPQQWAPQPSSQWTAAPAPSQSWNQSWQQPAPQVQAANSWSQQAPAQQPQPSWQQPVAASNPHPLVRPGGIPARSPASGSPSATPGLHQPVHSHAPMNHAFGGLKSPAGRPAAASPQTYPQQQVPQQYNPQHQTYVPPQFQQQPHAAQPFRPPQQSPYAAPAQPPASNRYPSGPFRY